MKPPKMARRLKASAKIILNIGPMKEAFSTSVTMDRMTYNTPITGTRIPVTFTIRLPPPIRQYSIVSAMMAPMT